MITPVPRHTPAECSARARPGILGAGCSFKNCSRLIGLVPTLTAGKLADQPAFVSFKRTGPRLRDPASEWRVCRPAVTKDGCLACHGNPAAQSPALRTALQTCYPADAATRSAADQWRGLFRVTLSPAPVPARSTRP